MKTNTLLARLARPHLWQLAFGCFWLALIVSTHVPPQFPGLPVHGVDKLAHFSAYAMLAGLAAVNWQIAAGQLTFRHLRWVWIAVVLFGVVDELTQPAFHRDASVYDWIADAIGAAVGLTLFVVVRAWVQSRRKAIGSLHEEDATSPCSVP